VTPEQAQPGESNSDQNSMPLDCLTRVPGAAWLVATHRPQQGRQNQLIHPNQNEGSPLAEVHDVTSPTCRSSCCMSAFHSSSTAPPRAMTTRRPPERGVRPPPLNHSRTRRLTRFRTTALPTFRLTVRPRRARTPSSSANHSSTNSLLLERVPRRATSRYSRDVSTLSARRKRRVAASTLSYLEGVVAARRFRPFARRRLSIARPARVDIRSRKPWVRRRRIRLG
jgi:hypothetical protein